jgi:hypothetical protein
MTFSTRHEDIPRHLQGINPKDYEKNRNYKGKVEFQPWMFSVMGYYSFVFTFRNRCKKELF